MSENGEEVYTRFILPPSIISKPDVARLVQEVERLDNALTAESARNKSGSTYHDNLQASDKLSDFLAHNKIGLTDPRIRTELIKQLRLMKEHAPTVHMTFAVETDSESLGKLAVWLRKSVHPQAVISVGLQPSLVAGVHLRTSNRIHDLSVKNAFKQSRGRLLEKLEELRVRS